MDRVLQVLFADSNYSDQLRLFYCSLSKEIVHDEEKTIELIVKNIKTLLITSKTRFKGLYLLSKVMHRLNNDVMTNNSALFIQPTIKVLQDSSSSTERVLAYKVLTKLFVRIYQINSAALTRDLSPCILPLLNKCFAIWHSENVYHMANCLAACATLFPVIVSSKRSFLESKLLETVDVVVNAHGQMDTLKVLGFCYVKVMFAGSSPVNRFREIFSRLMNTLAHYSNCCNTTFGYKTSPIAYKWDDDLLIGQNWNHSSNIFVKPLADSRRLHFLSSAICSALTGQYSVAFPLPVEAILSQLTHMSKISNANLKQNHQIEAHIVGYIVPSIHCVMLDIMKALLISCKRNLLPFVRLIDRIILSSIDWLEQVNAVKSQLYLRLRSSLYGFMSNYFGVFGCQIGFTDRELNTLVEHTIANIQIFETDITVLVNHSKPTSTRCNNALVEKKALLECTISALYAINSLLSSSSALIGINTYKQIEGEVLSTVFHIYRNWFNLSVQFKDEHFRIELLETLRLLLQSAPHQYNPAMESITVLLTQASRVENSSVGRHSLANCLALCSFIVDSRVPTQISNSVSLFISELSNENSQIMKFKPTEVNIPINGSTTHQVDQLITLNNTKTCKVTTDEFVQSKRTISEASCLLEASEMVQVDDCQFEPGKSFSKRKIQEEDFCEKISESDQETFSKSVSKRLASMHAVADDHRIQEKENQFEVKQAKSHESVKQIDDNEMEQKANNDKHSNTDNVMTNEKLLSSIVDIQPTDEAKDVLDLFVAD